MRKLLTAFVATMVIAAPAAAQDHRLFNVNLGLGPSYPSGDLSNTFDSGWNGTIGGVFNLTDHFGFEADYLYLQLNGPAKTLLVASSPIAGAPTTTGSLQSRHQMHVGSFNVVYRDESRNHPVGGYVLGGAGIYRRVAQLTAQSTGYVTFCDPAVYTCYDTPVSMDAITGHRYSNDPGIDVGGGVTFGREAKFFVEMRYHYVWGSTITPARATPASSTAATTPCSGGCTTNASYFPVTFGLKW